MAKTRKRAGRKVNVLGSETGRLLLTDSPFWAVPLPCNGPLAYGDDANLHHADPEEYLKVMADYASQERRLVPPDMRALFDKAVKDVLED